MSYLGIAKKVQERLKADIDYRLQAGRLDGRPLTDEERIQARRMAGQKADLEAVDLDPTQGRIVAVKIASTVFEADIWFAFKDDFKPDEGEPLAVFYADELEFLATKDT